ncbi:MAG TPA: Gfo/Idh/MocA family oxidoreductase [Chitinophagaceae bacterium]|nr:Gfo/Idh/MocA family oxidoreductase [Chitinophagaceae bacterium]
MSSSSRRTFIRSLGGTAALLAGGSLFSGAASLGEMIVLQPEKRRRSSDKVRIGTVGMGIMGFNDTRDALKTPGVELVGVADLYDGRLQRARELFGQNIFITRDYRELLERKDIDAILIATHDLWHNTVSMHAMEVGKAVYCEKPMVQMVDMGQEVVATQRRTGRVMQVGSQRVSSIAYIKARELYQSGSIGDLNMVEAKINRHDALGAWDYSIPPDASPRTIGWETFLKNTPRIPFDADRFFRWRKYRAYGTGIPGDLFVHLISGLHFITGSDGPVRIYASGELSFWKDGRDVPDVMVALFDYPGTKTHGPFRFQLQVNFADGSGGGEYTRLTGTEGVMEMEGNSFRIKHQKLPKAPGYGGWDSLDTFTEATQKAFIAWYNQKYPPDTRQVQQVPDTVYSAPPGYDEHVEHLANFFDSVRTGKPVVEDAVFGFRAAAPAAACNMSYFDRKAIHWDPINMKIT